ncbi:MAG: YeeE/YedE family protein, partial [Rhizobiales bacterium]|nr:YeeE/YedE family protein [Hyphomicrobiales bacterium]
MSVAAIEPVSAAREPEQPSQRDWPFLIASVLAAALLVALVLIDGQPAAAALLVSGFALGAVFLKAQFSFTASWRRLIVRSEADGFIGGLLVIAIAAAVIVPVAALVPGFGGAIAPLGPSLVIGAFVFGIGMQLANGCGSGTLYTVGGGSGRMLLTLAMFIIGSVIGSLNLPAFLALGGIDPILAANYLGPWGGLAATWASLAIAAAIAIRFARRRGAAFVPSRRIVLGAIAIGLLSIAVFAAGGH